MVWPLWMFIGEITSNEVLDELAKKKKIDLII